MSKIISLIVPAYNVEKYIDMCLSSCLKQDLLPDDYEIIVIIDGASDTTSEIVNGYVRNYRNIKVIHQANRGLSGARNTGLSHATGKYVWFIDSDDWIAENSLRLVTQLAEKDDLDILSYGVKYFHSETKIDLSLPPINCYYKVFRSSEYIKLPHIIPAVWNALIRREFLERNQLRFMEGILHEDQEFTPRVLSVASKIAYLHEFLYFYNQRGGSIMKSKQNERRVNDLLKVCDSLYCFARSKFQTDSLEADFIMNKISFCYSQMLAYYDERLKPKQEIVNKPYYPLAINRLCTFKEAVKFAIINRHLDFYIKFLSARYK